MAKKKDNKNLIIIGSIIVFILIIGIVAFSNGIKSTGESIFDIFGKGTVKEKVTCVFGDAKTNQECSSDYGFCRGLNSCSVTVKGKKGTQIWWKSTCEPSSAYRSVFTIIDGKDENAKFNCVKNIITINACESKGEEYKWIDGQCKQCSPSPHYKWDGDSCKPSCGWAGGQCNNGKCYKCSNGLCNKEEIDVWDC